MTKCMCESSRFLVTVQAQAGRYYARINKLQAEIKELKRVNADQARQLAVTQRVCQLLMRGEAIDVNDTQPRNVWIVMEQVTGGPWTVEGVFETYQAAANFRQSLDTHPEDDRIKYAINEVEVRS